MFGFKPKELNEALLLPNLANAALDAWLLSDALKPDQLLKDNWFVSRSDEKFADNLVKEKLALAVAFSALVIVNSLKREELVAPYFEAVKAALDEDKIDIVFADQAENYMNMFLEMSPRDAGGAAENSFAQNVFGDVPAEHEIDARYRLYKELTNFQRILIFKSQAAIRASR